jgi:hypothetical protein
MNFIKRKVFLTKDLKPFDTNGDGVFNALVLSATTKSIQVPLTHSYDDIGIFETSNNEIFEIIDIASIFDDTITGITQPNSSSSGITTIDWGNGTSETETTPIGFIVEYCNDNTATNYLILTATTDGYALYNPNSNTLNQYPPPSPNFIPNLSKCEYPPITDGDSNPVEMEDNLTDNISYPMQTLYNGCTASCGSSACLPPTDTDGTTDGWTTINSWSSYESHAEAFAISKCKSLYSNTTATILTSGDFPSGVSQGDCSTVGSLAFAGVKHHTTSGGHYCCTSNCGEDGETGIYTYRYRYCFYCKES